MKYDYRSWKKKRKKKKKKKKMWKSTRYKNDGAKTNFINHVKAIDDTICTSPEFRESYPVAGRKITWRSAKMRFLHAWLLRNCRYIKRPRNITYIVYHLKLPFPCEPILLFSKKKKKLAKNQIMVARFSVSHRMELFLRGKCFSRNIKISFFKMKL